MRDKHWHRGVVACIIGVLLAVPVGPAVAWATNGATKSNKASNNSGSATNPQVLQFPGVNIPGGNLPGQNQNLTPDEVKSIMMYRALQSRGSGQVRTGVPQFIPFGMQGMLPYSQPTGAADQQAEPDTARKSSLERRIAARKAAEEKKRAAREAKKAKAKQKDAPAKKAKAGKPSKDDVPPDDQADSTKK